MTITRIEFVGSAVMGPNGRMFQTYKPNEWPGWKVERAGEVVQFHGPAGSIEVPRSMCVIHETHAAAKESVPSRLQQAKSQAKSVAKKAEELL